MDQEQQLANPQLFAGWAGEDPQRWEQAVGASVTHLSRGNGTVTDVSREAGEIAIHVRYTSSVREHASWEFRTELTRMTLPVGLTRADLLPAARARRLLIAEDRRTAQEAYVVLLKQKRGGL